MNTIKKIAAATLAATALIGLIGCGAGANDADVVSENISTEADNFKVLRRVVFVNGITDNYLLSIEGWCNINDDTNQLEVTCKMSDGTGKKHFLGLSDNVTYFVEQLEGINVSADHYKVVFKPSVIIPDVDLK